MKRYLTTLFAVIAFLGITLAQARAQYTDLTAMRQVNSQHNDQSRFINVVHHFFTDNWQEAVTANRFYGWYFTGTVARVWNAQYSGTIPVYRMSRASTGSYTYANSWSQVVQLQAVGLNLDGIAFYVSPTQLPGTYPLYEVDRTWQPAQYFLWWQISPEVPETHMLTMRSSDVYVATHNYGFTTNQYYGYVIGYAYPGNMGVD